MRRALGLLLCAALVTPAQSAPAVFNPDPLTVSGRFELAKAAEGPLRGQLKVAGAQARPEDAKVFMSDQAAFATGLAAAMTASLRNFGYLAPAEAPGATSLEVLLDPLEITPDKDGVTVVARLRVAATGDAAGCLPQMAEAKYRALAQVHGGNGQRALGIIAVVAFAAIGLNAGALGAAQFQDARTDQLAANARRERIEGESVSPLPGDKQMGRYAATIATQLAAADFVRQLGKAACGAAVAPTPAATSPG